MSETEQKAKSILNELENNPSSYEASEITSRLDSSLWETVIAEKRDPDSRVESLELDTLIAVRNKNNYLYEVPLYPEKESGNILARLLKRIIRRLITPIIAPILLEQNKLNASVTTSINLLSDNECKFAKFMEYQEQLNAEFCKLRDEVAHLRTENAQLRAETISSRKQLHRELILFQEKLQLGDSSTENIYSGIDYEAFENHFRGSEEDIKARQQIYVPYFQGRKNVLDLGCGRGEFLELLKERDIPAIGIEQFPPFVQKCKDKDLTIKMQDAVVYVHNLMDCSIDGIFASQLAEHLKTSALVQLCNDAYHKLQSGGCLIFETPNPSCLAIYSHAFYIDPSHNKPVHPLTLEYILKNAGFRKIEFLYPESSTLGYRLPLLDVDKVENAVEFNIGINRISDTLFGYQDYAIIAYKE